MKFCAHLLSSEVNFEVFKVLILDSSQLTLVILVTSYSQAQLQHERVEFKN